MIEVLDTPLEPTQDILVPLGTAPLEVTLPEIILPEMSALSTRDQPRLVFTPAPILPGVLLSQPVPAVQSLPADRPAPLVRPRRCLRMDWYESAIIFLILSCAALCVYRLLWAVQP